MIKKWFQLVFAALLLLSLSACSFVPTTSDLKPGFEHTITVSGNGKVYLTPDLAYVYIGVQTKGETVGDALTANNAKAQSISSALQGLGVLPKDIQTSSFNIYPIQLNNPDGTLQPVTYNVDNTVYVTVRDLSTLGRLLDEVVRSGANTINSINFDVTDRAKALSEARRLAVEDARKQADEVAAAAGVKITDVVNLNINVSGGPIALYDAKAVGAGNAPMAQVPISAGQLMISVDVNVIYAIR